MKAHVFVISMLTGIVVTYAVLLLGCLFIDKTLPTVDVVILSLVVGASAQQLSRVLMSINSKRAARTVLTGMCYSVGSATRQGSSSPTRFIGQSAMTSRT